ncbi:SAM-dependent methyltransferase [Aquabacterium sp. A7-Y]|uniref:SAM-dependent methyltransferase n=1 Tax=Aquabacterium sp. A7-Y TaxID=1349605 RepID=UPI00223C8F7D|nr:SAM-dependent methyltransferase [Aquabacterium sp. A7-Y]MCW7541792.1 SAM-dependent methyltransferase [Aquabacterium sp. A7-Y]
MSGRLYLVPTPLDFGTLAAGATLPELQQVLPLQTLQTAARLEHWIAENARTTRAFLKRVHAVVPLARPLQEIAIQELPRPAKGGARTAAPPAGLDRLLDAARQGRDMGLVSEAGMPAIADPGAEVVRRAHELGLQVLPLVGPSALLLALAASGMNGQSFAFVGYLPVEDVARATRIRELETLARRTGQTQMMIETPYRNPALMGALLDHLQPTTRLSVACGLTLEGGWNRSLPVQRWKQDGDAKLPADVPAVFAIHNP